MNVLLINGAPQKNGFTDMLLELFKRGMLDAGGNPTEIVLRDFDIALCKGCFACWLTGEKSVCVQQDDMTDLIEKYLNSDVIVLASPIYYYSFTALLKQFMERLFPTTKAGLDRGATLNLDRLSTRDTGRGPKKAVLLALGAMRSLETMDGVVRTFELIVNGIGAKSAGVLLRPEVFYMDFAAGKPVSNHKVRGAFTQAGRELVKNGEISQKTQKAASRPFTRGDRHFGNHFTTYWAIACELGLKKADREAIGTAAARDLRILMHELASCFDPKAGRGITAVFQFDISDTGKGWFLKIENELCEATAGFHEAPTVTMTMSEQILLGIILNQESPKSALNSGAMKVNGPTNLLARFGRLFPPPNG